jgi:hypothetical protein
MVMSIVMSTSMIGCGAEAPPTSAAPLAVASAPSIDGARAWEMLSRALPGSWVMDGREGKPPFVVSYRLISNGSALVEVWGAGGSHETESIFHLDHADVRMTHYCAQGNQPRLRAVRLTADTIELAFVDVTNRAPDQDMLVSRTLHVGPTALEITETYRHPDGTDETTVHHLTKRPPTIS